MSSSNDGPNFLRLSQERRLLDDANALGATILSGGNEICLRRDMPSVWTVTSRNGRILTTSVIAAVVIQS